MNKKTKLLVTGGSGFVAGSVLAKAGPQWDLHAVSRGPQPVRVIPRPASGSVNPILENSCEWHAVDPLVASHFSDLFREIRPGVIIHTAALADIDFCEAHPGLARAVNVEFTLNLVTLCAEIGTRLVFCSTDTIFDGEHAPYQEDDSPGPLNHYARTKVEAEQIVSRLGARAVIARLSLVVGLPVLGAGNSFLARMIDSFKEGR